MSLSVATHVYSISEIPSKIFDDLNSVRVYKELDRDHLNLSTLLNITEPETPSDENFFEELEDHPVSQDLPLELINQLKNYSNDLFGFDFKLTYSANDENLLRLLKLRRLLSEQSDYMYAEDQGCNIWFIIATINNHLYGGTFLFQDLNNSKEVVMQGISKFFIPTLFSLTNPEKDRELPRLNSILQPTVEELAS